MFVSLCQGPLPGTHKECLTLLPDVWGNPARNTVLRGKSGPLLSPINKNKIKDGLQWKVEEKLTSV